MNVRVNGQAVPGLAEALPKGALEQLIQDCKGNHCPEYYGLRTADQDVVVMSKDLPRLKKNDLITVDGRVADVVFDWQQSRPLGDQLEAAKDKLIDAVDRGTSKAFNRIFRLPLPVIPFG